MDAIDHAILEQLQLNARKPVTRIAEAVNLSVPATSERLRRLETSGVIERYTAIINPLCMGKALTAFMFVSLERPQYNEAFVSTMAGESEVLECHYLAGDYDYVLKIVTRDPATLEQTLNRVKGVRGVQKTNTVIALSTVKHRYSVAPE